MNRSSASKELLRNRALAARKSLSGHEKQLFSEKVRKRLLEYLAVQSPRIETLLSYRATPVEVDTCPIFDLAQFRLFAPVTHCHEHMAWHEVTADTHWNYGDLGILEPSSGTIWNADTGITTLICPLTAFDRAGNRLGMGKGCFDFWLSSQRKSIHQIIGLAFSCQEVSSIPVEPHDIPMDMVITEKEVIRCRA